MRVLDRPRWCTLAHLRPGTRRVRPALPGLYEGLRRRAARPAGQSSQGPTTLSHLSPGAVLASEGAASVAPYPQMSKLRNVWRCGSSCVELVPFRGLAVVVSLLIALGGCTGVIDGAGNGGGVGKPHTGGPSGESPGAG